MSILLGLAIVFCAGLAAAWLWLWLATRRTLLACPRVVPQGQMAGTAEAQPKVSVIVPARNEAGRVLGEAIASLARQDYPNLEIFVVDDDSEDGTGGLVEDMRRSHNRLRLLRAGPLPTGWMGKVYALERGRRAATGDWILATDADVIHHPASVRAGVEWAEQSGVDGLTLMPLVECKSFWERVALPVISWMMIISSPFEQVNQPGNETSLGCGSYLLVRRKALEAIGSYHSLRAQVNEDGWTMRLLKRRGDRIAAADGSGLVRTRLYTGLREIWDGFGKSMFGAMRFNGWRAALVVAEDLLLGPVTTLLAVVATAFWAKAALRGEATWLLLAWAGTAAIALGGQMATAALVLGRMHLPRSYALFAGLGHLVASAVLLGSMWRIETGAGIEWKGRRIYRQRSELEQARREQEAPSFSGTVEWL